MKLTIPQRAMLERASQDPEGVFYHPGTRSDVTPGSGLTRTGKSLARLGLMREHGAHLFKLTSEGHGVLLDVALDDSPKARRAALDADDYNAGLER